MPGDVVPTAATLSPTPMARSAFTACGLAFTAAPISPSAGAASKTSAFTPKTVSAFAAASPASPPPTIAILQVDDDMRLSRCPPRPGYNYPNIADDDDGTVNPARLAQLSTDGGRGVRHIDV